MEPTTTAAAPTRVRSAASPALRACVAFLLLGAALTLAWYSRHHPAPDALVTFVGRFHALVVHLPITLLLFAPLVEFFARRRPAVAELRDIFAGLCFASAVLAVFVGLLLAWGEAQQGVLLDRHLVGGLSLLATTALLWCLVRAAAPARLACAGASLAIMSWTAHQGGALTHGEAYLWEHAPAPVRRAFGLSPPTPPAPEIVRTDNVYGGVVKPFLETHCASCHSASQQKGDLRLDRYPFVLLAGQSGQPAVAPFAPNASEVLRRLALPPDDPQAMPPRGQRRPDAAQVATLRWWIADGASLARTLAEAKTAAPSESAGAVAAALRRHEGSLRPRVPSYVPVAARVEQLARELGVRIAPISRDPTDGLVLDARAAARAFDDAALARCVELADHIVEMNLAFSGVTDAALPTIARFHSVRRLHLERTAIKGAGLESLRALARLEYLNLSETAVPPETLAAFKHLQRLYTHRSTP